MDKGMPNGHVILVMLTLKQIAKKTHVSEVVCTTHIGLIL